MNPAPGAWRLNTKHARCTSRSGEPGLVAATLLESKDIHIGSNLCKISLAGSLYDFMMAKLSASFGLRNNSEGSTVSRMSLVAYVNDTPKERIVCLMDGKWKSGFHFRLDCIWGRLIGISICEKSDCLCQPDLMSKFARMLIAVRKSDKGDNQKLRCSGEQTVVVPAPGVDYPLQLSVSSDV